MPAGRFGDRVEAGRLLGEELRRRGIGGDGGIVLGIPRGGVATAAEVARVLGLPLDQGLMTSCYVTADQELSKDDVRGLFEDAYGAEPFVEWADSPPGVREVRDTNICRIHATVEPATGRVLVFSAIDNLWKGAAGQAVQDLNLMLGLPETEGLGMVAGSRSRVAR